MAKHKQSQKWPEWIKQRTPNWIRLHSLLDRIVVDILYLAFGFIACALITALGFAKQFPVDPLAVFLIIVGVGGTTVTGIRLCKNSIPPKHSKIEARFEELIDEAENIRDLPSALTWMTATRSFLSIVGGFDDWQSYYNEIITQLNRQLSDDEMNMEVRKAVHLLKNFVATRKDHATSSFSTPRKSIS